MGLLGFILGLSEALDEDEKKKKANSLEKEMDNYGLDEEERELVRKGDYEPWNFEFPSDGEELDDDDYYKDDDF